VYVVAQYQSPSVPTLTPTTSHVGISAVPEPGRIEMALSLLAIGFALWRRSRINAVRDALN
jgi:hypothetical protein